jgi:hypothetical protein
MVDVTALFRGTLPPGFTLKEDSHLVFLFYKGKLLAVFTHTISAKKIEEEALSFLQKQKLEDQN